MYLENLVFDAVEPKRVGKFWEAVIGGKQLTDEPEGYETRLSVAGGPDLDLCFQHVPEPPIGPGRLHVDLVGAAGQSEEVDRLLGLGARRLDVGQGDRPGIALADPEGVPCSVVDQAEVDTGPIATLALESADPDRDAGFWSWLTGWSPSADSPRSLRHPSLRGPVLELRPEHAAKGPTKNRLHLDLRLESGDDHAELAAVIAERGGARLDTDWGDLPWTSYTDPSGNEFCLLPARASST